MPKSKDSGHIELRQLFLRIQDQMLANLAASSVFEHPTACGAATEQHWIDLLNHYLPQRYQAHSAFIIDAAGERSRQIDIAIFDRFYSPLFFHDGGQPHIPAESVYAVFEVKRTLTSKWIVDAGRKAASVRRLRRTSAPAPNLPTRKQRPILAGILSYDAIWAGPFPSRITPLLRRLPSDHRLDLGCVLRKGAFNGNEFSTPTDPLIYFMLSLMHRLQQMGAAPAIDFAEYARSLQ